MEDSRTKHIGIFLLGLITFPVIIIVAFQADIFLNEPQRVAIHKRNSQEFWCSTDVVTWFKYQHGYHVDQMYRYFDNYLPETKAVFEKEATELCTSVVQNFKNTTSCSERSTEYSICVVFLEKIGHNLNCIDQLLVCE